MKKVINFILAGIVIIGGFLIICIPEKESKTIEDAFYVKNISGYIEYVEFDGHQFIHYSDGQRGSICHSPNCHCLKEK